MYRALLAACLLLAWSPAWSQDADPDQPYKALLEIVKVTPPDASSDDCNVKGVIDFDAFAARMAIFREAYLLRDYSVDFYNQRRKQVLGYIVMKHVAELLTEGLYNGHERGACKFALSISYPDKFGQQRSFEALTWRFDNETSRKVNWPKFDPKEFPSVALDFTLSERLAEWAADEPRLGDAPKESGAPSCDMFLFKANAVFIRAISFRKKDYMDSEAGLYAVAEAKKCQLSDVEMKSTIIASMMTLDRIAKKQGKAAVCPFVESVAQEVGRRMR